MKIYNILYVMFMLCISMDAFANCEKATNNIDTIECKNKVLASETIRLKVLYKRYNLTLSGEKERMKLLSEEQKAWSVYSLATCKASNSIYVGGSAEPLVVIDCMISATKTRAEELMDRIKEERNM